MTTRTRPHRPMAWPEREACVNRLPRRNREGVSFTGRTPTSWIILVWLNQPPSQLSAAITSELEIDHHQFASPLDA